MNSLSDEDSKKLGGMLPQDYTIDSEKLSKLLAQGYDTREIKKLINKLQDGYLNLYKKNGKSLNDEDIENEE